MTDRSPPAASGSFVSVAGGPAASTAQRIAWDMAVQGASLSAIRDAIEAETGVRPSERQVASWNAGVRRNARDLLVEDARQAHLRQARDIEWLKDKWLPQAGTDVEAARFVLQLFERESKLRGLDAPRRTEVTHMPEPPTLVIEAVQPPNEARAAD